MSCVLHLSLWARPGTEPILKFDHLGLEQGLSQSSIHDILQDQAGFMWFATQEGLNKFDGYSFTAYKQEPFNPKSLQNSWVSYLFEQSTGDLWMVGLGGELTRFNREQGNFTRFNRNGEDPNSPKIIVPQLIYETRSGKLIMLGPDGFDIYDPSTETFKNVSRPNPQRITQVFQDKQGRIWMGSSQTGLFSLNEETAELTPITLLDERTGQNMPTPFWISIFFQRNKIGQGFIEDEFGYLWTVANTTISPYIMRFNPDDLSCRMTLLDNSVDLRNNVPTGIIEDDDGYIWTMFADRLIRFDKHSETVTRYRHDPEDPHSLNSGQLRDLVLDQYGVIWIASHGGISRYDKHNDRFIRTEYDSANPEGLTGNLCSKIYEDRSGTIWIGTEGSGLCKYSREKHKFRHYLQSEGENQLISQLIWALEEDQDGSILVGTNTDGLLRLSPDRSRILERMDTNHPSTPLPNNLVRVVRAEGDVLWLGMDGRHGLLNLDRKTQTVEQVRGPINIRAITQSPIDEDILWIGTQGRGLWQVERTTLQASQAAGHPFPPAIRALLPDDRQLWIGSNTGVFLYDPEASTLIPYTHDPSKRGTLSQNAVMSLHIDSKGVLRVGTFGGGLNRFNPETNSFTHFTMKDGLPNDVIYSILEDDQGMIWLATNNGLARWNPETRVSRNYDTADGLQSNEFNQGAYLVTRQGELLFGGINGFNAFYPKELLNNKSAPLITLSATKNSDTLIGDELPNHANIVLQPDDNVIEMSFAALDFAEPEKNTYAWMLEGFNDNWVMGENHRTATYTNLGPAQYRFRVKAANSDGTWSNKEAIATITVLPWFWQTLWFRLLMVGVGFLLIAFFFVRQRVRLHKRQEAALLAREHQRRSEELEYARQIQLAMLPKKELPLECLDIQGHMITASEVGGDYFDFFPLGDKRLCIAYGDATGHGVAAGLVVGMVKMAATVWALHPKSPAEMLVDLNTGLRKSLPVKSMGMAFALAVIDLEDHTMEIASSGMPYPFHYSAQNGILRPIVLKGPPLGFLKKIHVNTQKLQLHKGDQLIFLSDGFHERFNNRLKIWGERALEQSLSQICPGAEKADQVVEQLIKSCDAFAEGRPNDDDMTVVVMRVKAEAPAFARNKMPRVEALQTSGSK